MAATRFDRNLLGRMSRIHGQTRGILKMMHQNRPAVDILLQMLAVKSALSALIYPHLDKELRYELLQRVNTLLKTDDLSPEYISLLTRIRQRLTSCRTEEIPRLCHITSIIEIQLEIFSCKM